MKTLIIMVNNAAFKMWENFQLTYMVAQKLAPFLYALNFTKY